MHRFAVEFARSPRRGRPAIAALVSAVAAAGACSLVNAPDDVKSSTGTSTSTGGSDGRCSVDADCPKSDVACARYACALGGVCQLVTLADGTACDDDNICTVNDTCDQGMCKGGARLCPGQDACNVGICDELAGGCTIVPAAKGTACDDGDPCTDDGACDDKGACTKGPDACAKLATDCTDATCGANGCVTSNKQDGTFCGQSACSNGQCAGGHCNITAVNEGQACDDGLFCTTGDTCQKGHCQGNPRVCPQLGECSKGTCDEGAQQCVVTAIPDKGLCDDGDACTAGEFCSNQKCGGGLPPSTYFQETFAGGAGGAGGWTLGPEWQIGKAKASFGGEDGDDPGFDKSGEGNVAGVVLGGLAHVDPFDPTHEAYYLTSPTFNTDFAGTVYLTFYRWLNTDYQPYMKDTIEVSIDDGGSWTVIWENPFEVPINDASWKFQSFDITAFKGPKTRVRWGFAINSTGVYDEASWNIDAIKVQNAPCPL